MSLAFLLLKDKTNSIVTSSVTFNAPGNFIPPYGKTTFQITAKGTPGNASFYYTTTVPGNPNYNPYVPASGGNPLGTNTFYYNTSVAAQNPTIVTYNYEYVPAVAGNVISYYPASGGYINPIVPGSGGNTNPYYPASGGNTNPSTPGNPGTTNPIVPGTSGSIVQVTQYVHVWDVFAPRFNTPGYTSYYSNIDYQPWNNGTYRLGYYFASPYYFEFASGQSWYEVYQSYTDLGQYTNPATGGNTNPSNSPTPGTTNPYTPASGGTTNPYTPASGGDMNPYYPGYANYNPSTPAFYTSNANYNSYVPAFSYTTTVPGNPNYNPVVPASGGNVSGTNTVNQNILVPGNSSPSTNVLGVSLPGGAADSAAPVIGPTTISIDYTNAGTPISVPTGGYVTINYKPKTAP